MRVIAGELKGQRLVAPRGWKVRPTSDRVREAIFSALGDASSGARVLDLYCGTGALAIEALSRGAARGRPRRPRHPAGARQRRAPRPRRAGRAGPRRRRALAAASASAAPEARASTSSSSMPPIDSPTAWGQELDTHLPRLLADGGPGDGRERRPPPAADRLAGAAAPAPLRRRRRLHLRRRRRVMASADGTVVCPGSYDPVTNGHLDIITRTSNGLRAGRRRRRQQPDPQGEDAVHRRGAQGVHRGGDRRPRQRRGADLLQPAGRVRPRTTAPRRSSRACGRSPTSSTSSRWPSSTASSTPGSRAST